MPACFDAIRSEIYVSLGHAVIAAISIAESFFCMISWVTIPLASIPLLVAIGMEVVMTPALLILSADSQFFVRWGGIAICETFLFYVLVRVFMAGVHAILASLPSLKVGKELKVGKIFKRGAGWGFIFIIYVVSSVILFGWYIFFDLPGLDFCSVVILALLFPGFVIACFVLIFEIFLALQPAVGAFWFAKWVYNKKFGHLEEKNRWKRVGARFLGIVCSIICFVLWPIAHGLFESIKSYYDKKAAAEYRNNKQAHWFLGFFSSHHVLRHILSLVWLAIVQIYMFFFISYHRGIPQAFFIDILILVAYTIQYSYTWWWFAPPVIARNPFCHPSPCMSVPKCGVPAIEWVVINQLNHGEAQNRENVTHNEVHVPCKPVKHISANHSKGSDWFRAFVNTATLLIVGIPFGIVVVLTIVISYDAIKSMKQAESVSQNADVAASFPDWITAAAEPVAPSYAVCSMDWHGLNIVDLALLANFAYNSPKPVNNTYLADYLPHLQVMGNVTTSNATTDHVSYAGVRVKPPSRTENVTVLAVRGTDTHVDIFQDVNIWASGTIIKLAFSLAPDAVPAFIARWAAGPISWRKMMGIEVDYHTPVKTAIEEVKKHNETLVVTGHSLGGGIAKMAADATRTQSVAFASPGTRLIKRKLDLGNVSHVYTQSLTIKPKACIVSKIDINSGAVQPIRCSKSRNIFGFVQCHFLGGNVCTLIKDCGMGNFTFTNTTSGNVTAPYRQFCRDGRYWDNNDNEI